MKAKAWGGVYMAEKITGEEPESESNLSSSAALRL